MTTGYLALIVLEFAFIYLASKLERRFLAVCSIVNMIAISIFGWLLVDTFWLIWNVWNIFYASVFLSTGITIMREGEEYAYKVTNMILYAMVMALALALLITTVDGINQDGLTSHLHALIYPVPNLIVASWTAFYMSQGILILLSRKILKNAWHMVILTILIQFIDSLIFFPIAFGTLWFSMIWDGFFIKWALAILSYPILLLWSRSKSLL